MIPSLKGLHLIYKKVEYDDLDESDRYNGEALNGPGFESRWGCMFSH